VARTVNIFVKAPNVVVVCVSTLFGLMAVCVTVLVALNKDPSELRSILELFLTAIGGVGGIGAFLYSGAAARSGDNVERKLNGGLTEQVQSAVETAVNSHVLVPKNTVVITPKEGE
jgi:hypothetical protein